MRWAALGVQACGNQTGPANALEPAPATTHRTDPPDRFDRTPWVTSGLVTAQPAKRSPPTPPTGTHSTPRPPRPAVALPRALIEELVACSGRRIVEASFLAVGLCRLLSGIFGCLCSVLCFCAVAWRHGDQRGHRGRDGPAVAGRRKTPRRAGRVRERS